MSVFDQWMRNPICRVYFAGWESDTLKLQREGWEISAQQDPYRRDISLALYHRQSGLTALTNSKSFGSMAWATPYMAELAEVLSFNVVAMHNNIRAMYMPMREQSVRWAPISCLPECSEMTTVEKSIHDIVPFRSFNPDAEQIVVAPDSVPQVLDLLLKCQVPAAEARRTRQRKEAAKMAAHIQVA